MNQKRDQGRASQRMAGGAILIAALLSLIGSLSGCKPQPAREAVLPSPASSSATAVPTAVVPPPATNAKPTAAGWPAGDDAQASVETLRAQIEKTFNDLKFVEELIYPMGWTQRRYPAQQVTAEIVESDADGKPQKAIVKLTYQKLNSMIHPTQEAAAADTELLPYPADESREAMTGHKVDRRWPPTETEITYELQAGKWVRTNFKTTVKGREGSDWLDQIGIP